MENTELKQNTLPARLCSEIQLFDLCDLLKCSCKSGRYCSNDDLIQRFEKISGDEIAPPQMYIEEDPETEEDSDEDSFYEYGFAEDDENDNSDSY